MAWGRRKAYRHHMQQENAARTTLGASGFSAATRKIDELHWSSAQAMLRFDHTFNDVMDWLFDPEVLRIAKESRRVVEPRMDLEYYSLGSWREDTRFTIRYKNSIYNTIRDEVGLIKSDASLPLQAFINEADALWRKFTAVQHCLMWLDANATPGAMRYYWPAIMSLAGDNAVFKDIDGSRFKEPDGIGPMLPMLRETASTVASALLLSQERVVKPDNMVLTFDSVAYTHESGVKIKTDTKTYSLC